MPEPLMTIEAFADYIERLPLGNYDGVGFDMGNAVPLRSGLGGDRHACGTACCIGGHARRLLDAQSVGERFQGTISVALMELLGLPRLQAREVCYPYDSETRNGKRNPQKLDAAYKASPKQAAFLLRHLATAGVVDWDLAMQQEAS